MPTIKLTAPDAIFLDDLPVGTPEQFLGKYPHLASDFAAALRDFLGAQQADEMRVLAERARQAERTAAELKARHEPASLDVYFLVVELPESLRTADADHFGLRAIERGGKWRGDLLRALEGGTTYALFQAHALAFPVSEEVSSLSELTKANLESDLAAYAAAQAPLVESKIENQK
jgi:hypothetical protein